MRDCLSVDYPFAYESHVACTARTAHVYGYIRLVRRNPTLRLASITKYEYPNISL